jgi:hypothetical protein
VPAAMAATAEGLAGAEADSGEGEAGDDLGQLRRMLGNVNAAPIDPIRALMLRSAACMPAAACAQRRHDDGVRCSGQLGPLESDSSYP